MNIDQKESIEIITEYWSKKKPYDLKSKNIFVGDVHGDLNQFLLPLVQTGAIEIVNHIHIAAKGLIPVYVPDWIEGNNEINIYYLGDYIDGGIYSRTILCMMVELSTCKNIHFVIGNHDANVLGRYHEFENGHLNYRSLISYWPTLQIEVSAYEKIHMWKNNVEPDFLSEYFKPLFDSLWKLFTEKKLNVCYEVNLDNDSYIVSHTLITGRSIQELFTGVGRNVVSDSSTRVSQSGAGKPTVEEINQKFRDSSDSYIAANRLLYNRMERDLYFQNNIIGHTPGGDFRSKNINPTPSQQTNERREHCKPTFIDKNIVFYFDIKASCGYDLDNVSRPDYFYYVNKTKEQKHGIFSVSNANALRMYYQPELDILILDEYGGKNKTDGVIRIHPPK